MTLFSASDSCSLPHVPFIILMFSPGFFPIFLHGRFSSFIHFFCCSLISIFLLLQVCMQGEEVDLSMCQHWLIALFLLSPPSYPLLIPLSPQSLHPLPLFFAHLLLFNGVRSISLLVRELGRKIFSSSITPSLISLPFSFSLYLYLSHLPSFLHTHIILPLSFCVVFLSLCLPLTPSPFSPLSFCFCD